MTSSQSYPTIVANSLGMTKVNYAIRGTCMMSQSPSCRVDCRHMEYFAEEDKIQRDKMMCKEYGIDYEQQLFTKY